jgi:probable selenium-dependent hydroxylase accessory protein YqeC
MLLADNSELTKTISIGQAFSIHHGEVISLVGGGGKTTLMFALARELASFGGSVVTTTTTKILEPSSTETELLLLGIDEKIMLNLLLQTLDNYKHITVAADRLPSGKLRGVSTEFIAKLAELEKVSHIIIEADGADCKPLKAPGHNEPVIPYNTSLVIPVVGIDSLGCRLSREAVFRPEIVSRLTGLPLGAVISTEAIATLITHPEGIFKGSPAHARVVPLINKLDLTEDLSGAENLAHRILEKKHPRIERVVLGQVQLPEAIVEIISASYSAGDS